MEIGKLKKKIGKLKIGKIENNDNVDEVEEQLKQRGLERSETVASLREDTGSRSS